MPDRSSPRPTSLTNSCLTQAPATKRPPYLAPLPPLGWQGLWFRAGPLPCRPHIRVAASLSTVTNLCQMAALLRSPLRRSSNESSNESKKRVFTASSCQESEWNVADMGDVADPIDSRHGWIDGGRRLRLYLLSPTPEFHRGCCVSRGLGPPQYHACFDECD